MLQASLASGHNAILLDDIPSVRKLLEKMGLGSEGTTAESENDGRMTRRRSRKSTKKKTRRTKHSEAHTSLYFI